MKKKLIIVGASAFAEIAFDYFQRDSDFNVICFAVESGYLNRSELFGLPIIPFQDLQKCFDPSTHFVFVAVTYTHLNRLRTRLMMEVKEKGYKLASFVSPNAFIWHNVEIGEHCFIFEGNVLQPFVKIGSNVILWSGNHIGHHSSVQDNCFISSEVAVSGFCNIGENSFVGVNASISNNVCVGKDNWIGPGSIIMRSTSPGALFGGTQSPESKISSYRFFKVE